MLTLTNSLSSSYAKRGNNRDKLLTFLSDGRWHHMRDLERAAGMRYGARKWELEKLGYVIEKRHIGVDEWEYRLVMEGQRPLL